MAFAIHPEIGARFGVTSGNVFTSSSPFDWRGVIEKTRQFFRYATVGQERGQRGRRRNRTREAWSAGIEADRNDACPFTKRRYRRAWMDGRRFASVA